MGKTAADPNLITPRREALFFSVMLLTFSFFMDNNQPFESVLRLQPIDDDEWFVQGPGDILVDDQNRIHVVDLTAKTIFVWDKNGQYLQNYGRPGQGPGEFTFNSQFGGPQGYLSQVDGKFYIYDGGARNVSVFGEDLKYTSSSSFQIEAGRAEQFRIIEKDLYLIFFSSYFAEVPYRKIATYKDPATQLVEFQKAKDNTWHSSGDGNNRQVVLHAYTDALSMTYNQANGEVIVGDSSKPSFSVYDVKGSLVRSVRVALSQRELTQADKDEWNDMRWFRGQSFFKVSFPETKAFYDQVLPVGDKGYLVFLRSPNEARCEGIMVNKEGKTLDKFTLVCGNGGGLFGSRGRIFAVTTNDDGDYSINELRFGG